MIHNLYLVWRSHPLSDWLNVFGLAQSCGGCWEEKPKWNYASFGGLFFKSLSLCGQLCALHWVFVTWSHMHGVFAYTKAYDWIPGGCLWLRRLMWTLHPNRLLTGSLAVLLTPGMARRVLVRGRTEDGWLSWGLKSDSTACWQALPANRLPCIADSPAIHPPYHERRDISGTPAYSNHSTVHFRSSRLEKIQTPHHEGGQLLTISVRPLTASSFVIFKDFLMPF